MIGVSDFDVDYELFIKDEKKKGELFFYSSCLFCASFYLLNVSSIALTAFQHTTVTSSNMRYF
jgi:hypothetical protein